MNVKIAYGNDGLMVTIPDDIKVDIIKPIEEAVIDDPISAIREAIKKPDNSKPLAEIIKKKHAENSVIVISDHTRPCPTKAIILPLLDELNENGINDDKITLLIATGLHRKSTVEELERMLGNEILDRVDVVNHVATDEKSLEFLGESSMKTPIYINKQYLNSDLKILTSYVEPHFFAGFSGGRKSIVPGIAGVETILANHNAEKIAHENACFGTSKDNPIFEDALEIAKKKEIAPDFLINVCISPKHEITKVVTGNINAHGMLVEYQKYIAIKEIDEPYDVVIVNNGGAPLDLNLYQAVKSMALGALAVKEKGTIISVNELRNGVGHDNFGELLKMKVTPEGMMQQIIDGKIRIPDQWEIQYLCKALLKAEIYVVGNVTEEDLGYLGLKKAETVEIALEKAISKHGKDLRLLVLPNGPQIVVKSKQ